MALTDWKAAVGPDGQGGTSEKADTGSYSYKFEPSTNGGVAVFKESEKEAPSEGRISARAYFASQYDVGAVVIRYQDTSNFLCVQADPSDSVWRLVDGGYTTIDTISGGCPNDTWFNLKVIFWENAGSLYVRVKTDGSAVGEDLVDSGNSLSGGRGVGIANWPQSTNDALETAYFDKTELFY